MPCKNIMPRNVNGKMVMCPCGVCLSCKIRKMQEWKLRMMMEKKYYADSSFITLTYNDEHLRHLPDSKVDMLYSDGVFRPRKSILYKDLSDFNKRFRKNFPPSSLKFYACGEYGENKLRPHFHSIVFGAGVNSYVRDCLQNDWGMSDSDRFEGVKAGLAYAEADSMLYVTSYTRKKLVGKLLQSEYIDKGLAPPDSRCSQGIGYRFYLDNRERILRDLCIIFEGRKYPIPRYFVKKDDELQKKINKKVYEYREDILRIRGYSQLDIMKLRLGSSTDFSAMDVLFGDNEDRYYQSAEQFNNNLEDRLNMFQRNNTLIKEL